ncbi:unnamed protein product [Arctia plantaginis]|uniref:Uncharacterized protein n=1 Tax=Arctia plantaginis TaxID=874455 RepID=A0A8S0ZIP5_ARCPL|nr:unnamed protein product [Arctia plantaginis]
MSQPETPRTRQKGVLTRARARREQEEEVWEVRPTMGVLERGGEDEESRQTTGEHPRGRDNDDQYHSVRSGSTDSSPNRHAAPESVVTNRNKATRKGRGGGPSW